MNYTLPRALDVLQGRILSEFISIWGFLSKHFYQIFLCFTLGVVAAPGIAAWWNEDFSALFLGLHLQILQWFQLYTANEKYGTNLHFCLLMGISFEVSSQMG